MKLLLDTHIAIWLTRDAEELTALARRQIQTAESVFVSSASIWEATIKVALGKLPLKPARLQAQLLAAGIKPLPVSCAPALAFHDLPLLHKDPSTACWSRRRCPSRCTLLTHDASLAAYSPRVIVV